MNSLNSILIEGVLPYDPEYNADKKVCTFTVEFHRYYNQDNEKKTETGRVKCEIFGATAQLCVKTLAKGRGVRVVGRIKQLGDEAFLIIGENVEFKTKFDQKPEALT